jgi:hypothetical protein
MVDKLVHSIQRSPICGGLDLNSILFHRKKFNCEAADESIEVPKIYKYYGGGPSLVFSSDKLQLYASADLQEKQYKFIRCVNTEDKQTHISDNKKKVLCIGIKYLYHQRHW